MPTSALKTTGVITVSLGGVAAALTPSDAAQWLEVMSAYLPLFLCLTLMWWVYKIDRQHGNCQRRLNALQAAHDELRIQLLLVTGNVPRKDN